MTDTTPTARSTAESRRAAARAALADLLGLTWSESCALVDRLSAEHTAAKATRPEATPAETYVNGDPIGDLSATEYRRLFDGKLRRPTHAADQVRMTDRAPIDFDQIAHLAMNAQADAVRRIITDTVEPGALRRTYPTTDETTPDDVPDDAVPLRDLVADLARKIAREEIAAEAARRQPTFWEQLTGPKPPATPPPLLGKSTINIPPLPPLNLDRT
jgi:hypothetical protein